MGGRVEGKVSWGIATGWGENMEKGGRGLLFPLFVGKASSPPPPFLHVMSDLDVQKRGIKKKEEELQKSCWEGGGADRLER